MKYRFIDADLVDRFYGPALFEAVMKAVEEDAADNTLLFWRPTKPAVYIGYHQLVSEDINVDACRRMKIPIIRRILGGGTGFCDRNVLIYNIIFREDSEAMPHGPRNVYMFTLQGLVEALYSFGIRDVEIEEERYGVYANGRKISGSGQLTSRGVVNTSGSFLVDFDVGTMSKLLKNPVKNLKKGVEKPEDGITWLRNEIPDVTVDDARKALREGFEKILGKTFDGGLSSYEGELADELKGKYLEEDWIYRADLRKKRRR